MIRTGLASGSYSAKVFRHADRERIVEAEANLSNAIADEDDTDAEINNAAVTEDFPRPGGRGPYARH
jgi:hypothetical protein